MFFRSYSPNDLTTLDEYVSRMKKGQDRIYYIGSSSREAATVSPYLDDLYSRGIEVIFAVEPIDLYCLDRMEEFDGVPLENPEREKEKGRRSSQDMSNFNITQRDFSQISRWFKKVIGDRLDKITLSTRLKSTPAIATCTNWGYTASHERLIRAQTVHDQRLTDSILLNRKVLELNPEHPVIIELFNRVKARPDDQDVIEGALLLLYDTALIAGGFTIDAVLNYTKRIFKMLGRAHTLESEIESAIDY
jgi:HSP90 family molecular chaperone